MELCYANNEQSLFRKYAELVTWFTQHQLGRDYLGIKDKDISLLLPNGFRRTQQDINQSTFYSDNIYEQRLYPALARIDAVSAYFSSFDDALKTFFYQTGLIRNPGLVPDVMLTESTFYTDSSTNVDGQLIYNNNSGVTWDTIHDATTGTSVLWNVNEGGTAVFLRADGITDKWDYIIRAGYLFDSSSIDDGDTVSAATLGVYTDSMADQFGGGALSVDTFAPASNTALATADYNNFGDTKQATDLTSVSSNAYTDWTFNSTGLSNISKTAICGFGIRISFDIEDSPPTWSSGKYILLQVYHTSNQSWSGGANKPRLVVTHAAGGGGSTFKPKIITY